MLPKGPYVPCLTCLLACFLSQAFLAVAAHQVIYSVWILLAFCSTPLERAAITFLPLARPMEVKDLERLLIDMAAAAGLGLGSVILVITIGCPELVTQVLRPAEPLSIILLSVWGS